MTIHLFGDAHRIDSIIITLDPKDVEHMLKGHFCQKKPFRARPGSDAIPVPGFGIAIVEDDKADDLYEHVTKDLEVEYDEESGE